VSARCGVADGDRLGQDLLHAIIGVERLAFLDADCGELSDQLRIESVGRLVLDHRIELLVESEVIRMDGVHLLA